MTINEAVLFYREPHGAQIQEYMNAVEELYEIQNLKGHKKCPNTNIKPTACSWCESNYGNKYRVWHLLTVINAPLG